MSSNIIVLHIILYKADFFSNLMNSILYLGKEIKKRGSNMIICIPERKDWIKFFEKQNIKVEFLPINSIFDYKAVKILKNIIKKYKINIIHTHFGLESQVIPVVYKILFNPNIKIIWQWRNPPRTDIIIKYPNSYIEYLFAKYKRRVGNFFYKILDSFVSTHIVVSNEIRDILIKRKIGGYKKIKVILNGINIEEYNPKENFIQNYKTIANISNFRKQKDHITFIKAAKLVIAKYPETKFILTGDGPTKFNVMAYAKKIGILNNLIFTGIKKDVKEIINNSNFTVLSSFYEGLPNVVLESMALKRPVIATNVGGVPDIIKNGYNGFLVPVKNYKIMAEKMLYFIENTDEIKKMGNNGRRTIEEKFSIEKWAKEIISTYNEILEN